MRDCLRQLATSIQFLKGVGPKRADAIVAYRQQHGQFRSVDELALVKGIGRSVIERNRPDLRLVAASPAVRATAPAVRPVAQPAAKGR